jgi:hypothetical protein
MGFEVFTKKFILWFCELRRRVAAARVQSQVRLYEIRCGKKLQWGSCFPSTSVSPASSHYTNCSIFINSTKTEFLLDNIQKFSSYLTGNTLRLRYRDRSVNAVYGEKCLFTGWTIRNTQIHCVGRMQSFTMLQQVVHMLTNGFNHSFYHRCYMVSTLTASSKKNKEKKMQHTV